MSEPENINSENTNNASAVGSDSRRERSLPETEIREADLPEGRSSSGSFGAAAQEALGGAGRGRDISASTLVRLLGLPTKSELDVIETKLDTLNAKLTSLTAKLERLNTQVPQLFSDFDRTNVQIADLREFIRKALSAVVAQIDTGARPNMEALSKAGSVKPDEKPVNVLSSES